MYITILSQHLQIYLIITTPNKIVAIQSLTVKGHHTEIGAVTILFSRGAGAESIFVADPDDHLSQLVPCWLDCAFATGCT